MLNTAFRTHPLSYSKMCDTFRAADCTAARTHLGGEALINLDAISAVPDGFVAELGSKLRPTGIEHGLSEAGSGKSGSVDVTDAYASVLAHEPRRELVQEMLAGMGDLGVKNPYSALTAGPLRKGELLSVARELPRVTYLFSGGKAHQMLETQVDSDLPGAAVFALCDLEREIEIPAATRILREAAAVNLAIEGSAEPQSVAALQKDRRIAIHTDCAGRLERDPTERFAPAPSTTASVTIARSCKLLTDRLYGIRVQPEFTRDAVSEADQIVSARPTSVPTFGGSLRVAAEVPYEVNGACLRIECSRATFDAISASQNHLYRLTAAPLPLRHQKRGFHGESLMRAGFRQCACVARALRHV